MKLSNTISKTKKTTYNLLLHVAIGLPILMCAHMYAEAAHIREDEAVAFFTTLYVFGGAYIGRYMSQLWTDGRRPIISKTFILLGVFLLASLLGLMLFSSISINTRFFMPYFLAAVCLLVASVTAGIIITLVRHSVAGQIREARVSAEQSNSELKLLQSQLSPHFLFNTLNNIYGISLNRSEKVPALLLKLSDLLRYSVYEAREEFVPLQSEMEYVYNYIDFEKIRIGEKLVLTTEFEYRVDPGIKIAPLLLIVFIENAFKHAKNTTQQEIYIDIKLKIWGNSVLFAIKNSNKRDNGERGILNVHSGFGLDNVRKRLELLYPNRYALDIEENEETYNVMLQLRLKK
ncbi:sensor histidine kinase [Paraflavitalea pollutisoli]|uniref:sensor histidine kinase n=1 Tax=Paraflavitalea pollutisoli TaxID=3034143 RepID=UPI0023ECCA68|nr:histidine kinase [Paraflavitalea sp. H1-2-19X]